jgi:hypothetical protein
VLEVPLAVDLLDAELRVLPNPLRALVRPEPRVVVDRVVGEVRGDQIGVARVERLVVGADVVEVADDRILTFERRFGGPPDRETGLRCPVARVTVGLCVGTDRLAASAVFSGWYSRPS